MLKQLIFYTDSYIVLTPFNKAKNIFFITFLPFYFLSFYEIELQEEHY